MHQRPNPEEKLKNAALFLCLAERLTTRRGVIGDGLRVQKCTFLVTLDHFSKKLKGFNLTFFRYDYGPFSTQLWDMRDQMLAVGLIAQNTAVSEEVTPLALTPEGRQLAVQLCSDIWQEPQNEPFVDGIERVSKHCANLPTQRIMDEVYALEVQPMTGPRQSIRAIPKRVDITQVLDTEEAVAEVFIPPGWMDTLAILMSPKNRGSVELAVQDLKHGRMFSHQEVWA